MDIKRFDSREAATHALAITLGQSINDAVAAGRRAWLCLSGGSSPVALFRELGATDLPWASVDLTLSDERWVPADHADSNEALVRRELLSGTYGAGATLHGLYRADAPTPEAAVESVDEAFAAHGGDFDYCLLGMGGDGHTASLFPDAPDIDELLAHDGVSAAVNVPRLPQARITLSPARLLASRRIGLLLFGADKHEVLARAMEPGDVRELPVRVVLHQQHVPVECYWAP